MINLVEKCRVQHKNFLGLGKNKNLSLFFKRILSRRVLPLILSVVLMFFVSLSYPQSAKALIRQQEEVPGQMLYQARHTLWDNRGESWQVILFKRIKDNQVKDVDLRLVGFPEQTNFIHPQPLVMTTNQGQIFQAEDLFAEKSPGANVGQYDFKTILPKLSTAQGIELNLPLKNDDPTYLTIPLPVILEWQEIMNF